MNISERASFSRTGVGYFDDEIKTRSSGWSINQQYTAIIVGDAYCGKSTYIQALIKSERFSNAPVTVSEDQNEVEFWVRYKDMKAIFNLKDTGNLERFRSLTQSYYKKAQCILLVFSLNNEESFFNLKKWYMDIISYTNNQSNLSIILVGLKALQANTNTASSSKFINSEFIELFQQEHDKIVGYCEFDLNNSQAKQNLKEPFEMFLNNNQIETIANNNGRKSIISMMSTANYSTINRLEEEQLIKNSSEIKKQSCCILI